VREIEKMADGRDPKSRHFAPGGVDAGFGHFALKWDGQNRDFFRGLSETEVAIGNCGGRHWQPCAEVPRS